MERLIHQSAQLSKGKIIKLAGFLSSRIYAWQKETCERKKRTSQIYAPEVDAALANMLSYPYMGGKKGALMLAYHQIEYMGQRCYDHIKQQLKVIIYAEIKQRQLLRSTVKWPKPVANSYGEIWCADFTHVQLYGQLIYIAVVLDDYSHYYLGYAVSDAADVTLIDHAFEMALQRSLGVLPELCMVNDRGSQYKAELYKKHLKRYDIQQQFIPKGTPWNNGEAEVGMKDIQALMYRQLAQTPRKRGQQIVEIASALATEVFKELNDNIPRPKLCGVTPTDVVTKQAESKRTRTQAFMESSIALRPMKTRIDDLSQYISDKLNLNKWSNRSLLNYVHLVNHKYHLIVPQKV